MEPEIDSKESIPPASGLVHQIGLRGWESSPGLPLKSFTNTGSDVFSDRYILYIDRIRGFPPCKGLRMYTAHTVFTYICMKNLMCIKPMRALHIVICEGGP
jgi:hypothetical protein